MSEFLAEAQVLIRPDTTAFRAQLVAQLAAIKVPPVVVPVAAVSAGAAGVTAANAGLARSLERTAGAQNVLDKATKRSTASLLGAGSASQKLDAALLGLRTAVGGAAVIGLGALALGAIAAGKALRATIDITAEFESNLNAFQVIAGATADEMERVSEAAIALGADVRLPGVSAADAATAMTELAKAGLDVQDALDGAAGVLQLATAAQISNAEASQIAANALNSFGLAGDQAVRVADVLANAANAAQGSITDFGIAMRQTSAVARQVGLSLEDTTALLSLFAKNGLSGSDAGTSLRVALIRLIAPTKKAAEEIDKLGLKIRDGVGNFRPDVFAQFGRATEDLTPAVRDAAAALIFGTDSIRALSIGAREGAEGLRLMQFEIDQQGTAAEVAAARTKGLAGSFLNLQNQASTAALTIGDGLGPALQEIVDVAAFTVSGINEIGKALGRLAERIDELPGEGWGRRLFGEFSLIPVTVISKSAEELDKLNAEMQALQDARIGLQKGGFSDLADELTKDIERVRGEIAKLGGDSPKVELAITAPLRAARDALRELIATQSAAGKDVTRYIQALIKVNVQIEDYEFATKNAKSATDRMSSGFDLAARQARAAASSVGTLTGQVKILTRESAALGDQLLKIQSEGGTPGQQIAVLQQDIAAQRDLIVEAQSGPAEGRATAIRAARKKIIADQNEIESLQAGIESDAKAAAASAESAAKKIAAAALDADKALAKLFTDRRGRLENLIDRAGSTDSLKDDIRFTKALRKLIQDQIDEARKRIKDVAERRDFIKAANDLLVQLLLDIKKDKEQMARDAREAIQTKQANILEGIELDVELADINENTNRRIALRKRLIAALLRERKVLHLTGNALKENRNEIARINAEIEEIKNETKETGKGFAALAFEFLQTQQGFASNLLGNLFPSSAVSGLVGGSQAQTPENLVSPTAKLQAQAAGGRVVGPTFGQMQTEVDVLKQVLQVLKEIQRGKAHPEARYQKTAGGAALDVM